MNFSSQNSEYIRVELNGLGIDDRIGDDGSITPPSNEKRCIPTENFISLVGRFDSASIKYTPSNNAGRINCNQICYEGLMATLNSPTVFYFFHVPMDIYTNQDKRKNIVRAVDVLTL